jgi:hypothetical protein
LPKASITSGIVTPRPGASLFARIVTSPPLQNLHSYCNEYWDEDADGEYALVDVTVESEVAGEPYRFFDQGRSRKVDDLLDAAERHNVAVMLTLWPHPDLRETGTGWDRYATSARYGPAWHERSGHWLDGTTDFTNNDAETQAVASNGSFTGWAALSADPVVFADAANWTGAEGLYQRSFLRYVVARWGCRRGLGMYELVSEVGGTGLSVAQEGAWRANVAGFLDSISPYKQPLSSSTHSVTTEPDITDGNYVCTNGYCTVNDGTGPAGMNDDNIGSGSLIRDTDAYRRSLLQEHSAHYAATSALGMPVFCGEVGACQRRPGTSDAVDRDLPLALTHAGAEAEEGKLDADVAWRYRRTVSTFHYVVWTALLSKGAAAPLAWSDGKEFGEMNDRAGNVRFSDAGYEINYLAELRAAADVVAALGLDSRLGGMTPTPLQSLGGLDVFVLQDATNALVWACLQDSATPVAKIDLSIFGVTWPTGDARWFNPWTGAEITPSAAAQDLTDLDTRIAEVVFSRPCAGAGDGSGPHEREDVLIWVTKN